MWRLSGPQSDAGVVATRMPLIAVDAMGGDAAPREIVEGAILAAQSGASVVLVGDEAQISPLLDGRDIDIDVQHASEVITMDDVLARAIREKKDASVTVAARMVSSGGADGMVSAGSTGAALASAAFLIGRLPGVKRPGIASIFPTGHVVVDVGANIECKPEHLVQFAVMGSALSTVYQGIDNPRVGLLNIGEEDTKGRDLERQAFNLLRDTAAVNFVGNIEGSDLATDVADVIVTDGFTGNVLLKTGEGTARVIQKMIFETLAEPKYVDAVQDLMPAFMEIRQKLSAETVGGAHLVGTKGVVVIAHGSSSRFAISNAIAIASEGVSSGLVARIGAGIAALEH
ncbi:MAG: phosphate acyltransferase PlsX [Actinomycetota bacterium]|nr:phosphate acyltransferase PlsX [Actinomycetota bacterium]